MLFEKCCNFYPNNFKFCVVKKNNEIIINTTTHFYKDKKLSELLCIKNDFAEYFAKHFVSHSMVINKNNKFLYYRSN